MKQKIRHIFHIYHPGVVFLYIAAALVFAMLSFHPVYLAMNILIGSGYAIYLSGWRQFRKTLFYALFLFVLIALINPFFNQNGATVFFYLFGRVITVESAVFGLASGGMLMSVLIWFNCYRHLISNEKFLFLFGRTFPTLALMLAMINRLIPAARYKALRISQAQKAVGFKESSRKQKIHRGIRISSILMSWTMEDSIDTSDSMLARGYGQARRTTYSLFRWSWHDTSALVILLCLITLNAVWMLSNSFAFYPVLSGELLSWRIAAGYLFHALLLLFPLILEMRESFKWT